MALRRVHSRCGKPHPVDRPTLDLISFNLSIALIIMAVIGEKTFPPFPSLMVALCPNVPHSTQESNLLLLFSSIFLSHPFPCSFFLMPLLCHSCFSFSFSIYSPLCLYFPSFAPTYSFFSSSLFPLLTGHNVEIKHILKYFCKTCTFGLSLHR